MNAKPGSENFSRGTQCVVPFEILVFFNIFAKPLSCTFESPESVEVIWPAGSNAGGLRDSRRVWITPKLVGNMPSTQI